MADIGLVVGSDSTHSEFEEVGTSVVEGSNFSDGEIIDTDWHYELEVMLDEAFVDQGMIKNVCKCRNIPDKFRGKVWKICLNVANRGDAMSSWDGKHDPVTEKDMRNDCNTLVQAMIESGTSAITDKEKTVENAMAVFTFYCKCRAVKYHCSNGWVNILRPLLELGFDRGDLYNCFYAIQSRFIPRKDLSPQVSAAPFHLLRLLLLYHDPELCNFLDTCKISTESFTKQWFSTLFSSHCSSQVSSAIWDIYLQQADSFFVFFLALVILVNAKEQVMANIGESFNKEETIETLSNSPSVLSIDDVDDFCQLALYYCDRTPSSFRRDIGGCFYLGSMAFTGSKLDSVAADLAQSFCLKVSIPELLLSSQPSLSDDQSADENGPKIRFFVVDCRPADLYNQGHLLTAFHLDATLMLSEPTEFDAALKSLFAAQEQAMQAGSAAAGEHLCFIGSGNEEEDQYMHMVVANLLQKHQAYVSMARGGFTSLMEYLTDVGIDLTEWIVGAERPAAPGSNASDSVRKGSQKEGKTKAKMEMLMKRVAGNVLEKTNYFKDRVAKFIELSDEEWEGDERPSTSGKKTDQSVFTIGDENENSDEEQQTRRVKHQDIEALDTWKAKPDVKHCFECQVVAPDSRLIAAHLLVTSENMFCLVEVRGRRNKRNAKQIWVKLKQERLLCTVAKITSRRSLPELITFKFGDINQIKESDDVEIVAADRYLIPNAGDATRLIKQLIVEADERRQKKIKEEDEKKKEKIALEGNETEQNKNNKEKQEAGECSSKTDKD